MTSEELATEVWRLATLAISRVKGVGADQYDNNGVQKFETLTMPELVEWLEEEIADVMVYSVMAAIRVTKLVEAARRLEKDVSQHPDYQVLAVHKEAAEMRLKAVANALHGDL